MKYILLVDDDEDMIKIVARWLEKAGYEVSSAASGKAAVAAVSERTPDLVLLDYSMPDMDGPATLAAIREAVPDKNIPVLFRTGKDDLSSQEIMEKCNPAGVISKAEGKPALLAAIAEIC
ncbi:Response regulator receiver domain-containing protein [Butyrivibrio sp. ob235]|uniref:response regulator n=1 Tax=Butyrivibrio sp. ob235 TaxID=1761780 RepID=UPI0008CC0730|nr:response regulator [Butyrivibrio sp. ob235]SEL37197.1 Response regulator receiver domain-containing protein [Butyrivibrio sp. ob235]